MGLEAHGDAVTGGGGSPERRGSGKAARPKQVGDGEGEFLWLFLLVFLLGEGEGESNGGTGGKQGGGRGYL